MLEIMCGPCVSSLFGGSAPARRTFHLLRDSAVGRGPLLGDNRVANILSTGAAMKWVLLALTADALRLAPASYIRRDCNAGQRALKTPERPPPSRRDWNDFIQTVPRPCPVPFPGV